MGRGLWAAQEGLDLKILLNATDGALSLRAIRRFVIELASGLTTDRPDLDVGLTFFTHRRRQVRDFLSQLPAAARYRVHWFPVPRRFLNRRHLRPRWELDRLANRYDLYHETTTDNPRFASLPVVTSVHGLCTLVAPEILDDAFNADKTSWFDRCVSHSDFFAPVSVTSRNEFLERFDVEGDRVRAIPLGVSAQYQPAPFDQVKTSLRDEFGIDDPYVLYVGGIQNNKNVAMVFETFRRLVDRDGFEGKLVLVGDLGYSDDRFREMLRDAKILDRVAHLGCFQPEDPRLARVYQGARLFLFPSFYEGWTSPPLEAMASGVPTIASSASSIPETVGDGALLADPRDPDAWYEASRSVLSECDERQQLIDRGVARAAEYPWRRHVDATVEFYREIVERTGAPSARALSVGAASVDIGTPEMGTPESGSEGIDSKDLEPNRNDSETCAAK